jgi:streptogramin lyase
MPQENEMSRKQQCFFISMVILLVTITCQVNGNPVPTSTVRPTQPAITPPLFIPLTPTVSAGNDLHAIFPSFSLTGPNTVCVEHYYYALSCLDATGWHIYENGYDETSNPTSTIPRMMFGCPDGRIYLVDDGIYQVQGETLVNIGGYVDQGIIACGSGNEIWVSDYSEVRRFDGSTWTSYSVEEYFESYDDEFPDSIYSLAVAPNGNVWVTTNKTVATFDGSEWRILAPPGNYYFMQSGGPSQGLTIDSSGVVWMIAYPETCCMDNQLLKYDGIQWATFPGPEDGYYQINIIAVDHENRIWAATNENKLYTFSPKTNGWDLQFDVRQLGLGKHDESAIDGMEFDGQGRLWVTTDYGLGIYDGVTWTTYHTHTANLYVNEANPDMNHITNLFVLGDGPPLPALEVKVPGSVLGRLVSETSSPFTDAQVEICLVPGDRDFSGDTPCSNQAYHALADVNTDGGFFIPHVPAGTYYLMIKISNLWSSMVKSDYPHDVVEFIVMSGEETQLGEISTP